jgi:hypothetical protein
MDCFCFHQVEFSPFEENKLAVSTAQHFGIIGNGKQYILDVSPHRITELMSFDTRDGVYDCAWSECNENHLISGSGDGSVKMCGIDSSRHCVQDSRSICHWVELQRFEKSHYPSSCAFVFLYVSTGGISNQHGTRFAALKSTKPKCTASTGTWSRRFVAIEFVLPIDFILYSNTML